MLYIIIINLLNFHNFIIVFLKFVLDEELKRRHNANYDFIWRLL